MSNFGSPCVFAFCPCQILTAFYFDIKFTNTHTYTSTSSQTHIYLHTHIHSHTYIYTNTPKHLHIWFLWSFFCLGRFSHCFSCCYFPLFPLLITRSFQLDYVLYTCYIYLYIVYIYSTQLLAQVQLFDEVPCNPLAFYFAIYSTTF